MTSGRVEPKASRSAAARDALPAIHALLLVRDEADIIDQCLDHLLEWAASLSIVDTGSVDGTWEAVNERALRDPRIHTPLRSDEPFRCGLRAHLLDAHRDRFRRGDWLARVDADEFYHVDPREFIRDHVAPHEGRVAMWQYLFVVTASEARAWRQGLEGPADRETPIEHRRRHFIMDPFPEQRLFRYRTTMRWHPDEPHPRNPGPMAIERIPVRHYRFRDLGQMRVRARLRRAIAAQTTLVGRHWEHEFIRHRIVDDDDPALRCWVPGTPLPTPDGWPDPDAHLRAEPIGRLGHWCHCRGLSALLDFVPQRRDQPILDPRADTPTRRLPAGNSA